MMTGGIPHDATEPPAAAPGVDRRVAHRGGLSHGAGGSGAERQGDEVSDVRGRWGIRGSDFPWDTLLGNRTW